MGQVVKKEQQDGLGDEEAEALGRSSDVPCKDHNRVGPGG